MEKKLNHCLNLISDCRVDLNGALTGRKEKEIE